MKKALEKFRNSEWRSQELERHTVVETIVVPPVRLTVEPIPWAEWQGSVVTDSFQDDSLARHVFQHACMWANRNASTCNLTTGLPNGSGHRYPIALQKFQGAITALATNRITKGCLAIPVFCMRDRYRCWPNERASNEHLAVIGLVKWKHPSYETCVREVEVEIHCQPERRSLTNKGYVNASDYDQSTDCHPFWHIRRSNCVGEFNCEVVGVDINVSCSSSMKELQTDGNTPTSCGSDFNVIIPCITNTEDIAAGAEIVLKLEKLFGPKEVDRHKKRAITAYTALSRKKMKR